MISLTGKNIKNLPFKSKLNSTNSKAKYLKIELKICKQSPLEKSISTKIKLNSTNYKAKYLRIELKICKQTVKIKLVKLNHNMKSI